MSWCNEITPNTTDNDFCEGELIFQLTYSYILFCSIFSFINFGNDLLF